MTPFPPSATVRELYAPAMLITEEMAAKDYFEALVDHQMTHGKKKGFYTRAEAETLVRTNLAYYAGYYDSATRERVERLFHCAHPIFGAIAKNGPPTSEEAFELGRQAIARGVTSLTELRLQHDRDMRTIELMRAQGGSFVKALAEAALHADPENLQLIKSTWPKYWNDYAQRDVGSTPGPGEGS